MAMLAAVRLLYSPFRLRPFMESASSIRTVPSPSYASSRPWVR